MSKFGRRFSCRGYLFLFAAEQSTAQGKECSAVAVGEETEVADADEARRQQMEQKAAQELIDREGHESLLVAVRGIPPAESDLVLGESDQPGVGNGDAMSVGAEIAQRMFRATERPLGVDDPIVSEQHA